MAAKEGFRVKFQIEGDELAAKELREIGLRAWEAKPVLRVIKRLMERGAIDQFASEGASAGVPWQPDLLETVEAKQEEGMDPRTMYRTGRLAASIIGGPGVVRHLSRHSTTFGTKVFEARFAGHRRDLLSINYGQANRWTDIMVNWLLAGKGDIS